MKAAREAAIEVMSVAKTIGIILGTLGRQGSPKVLEVILPTHFKLDNLFN